VSSPQTLIEIWNLEFRCSALRVALKIFMENFLAVAVKYINRASTAFMKKEKCHFLVPVLFMEREETKQAS